MIGIIYEARPNVTVDAAGPLPQVGQRAASSGAAGGASTPTRRWSGSCGTPWSPRPAPRDCVALVHDQPGERQRADESDRLIWTCSSPGAARA